MLSLYSFKMFHKLHCLQFWREFSVKYFFFIIISQCIFNKIFLFSGLPFLFNVSRTPTAWTMLFFTTYFRFFTIFMSYIFVPYTIQFTALNVVNDSSSFRFLRWLTHDNPHTYGRAYEVYRVKIDHFFCTYTQNTYIGNDIHLKEHNGIAYFH